MPRTVGKIVERWSKKGLREKLRETMMKSEKSLEAGDLRGINETE